MKTVKVLGTGCAKCQQLAENVAAAARASDIACEIEHVRDIAQIMQYAVMLTPALVVDGVVKSAGRVPPVDEVKTMLE